MSKGNIIQAYFKERGDSQFNTGPYSFKNTFRSIKVGDLVIVETKYGPNLAKVTKIVKHNELYRNADINPRKRVITRVNIDKYLNDLEQEKIKTQLNELREKIIIESSNLLFLENQYNKLSSKLKEV